MDYTFVPMNDEQARAVAAWKYDGDYAFYNWTADANDLAELLDPVQREEHGTQAVLDEEKSLVGFFEFKMDESTAEFGLGLRPDLTGRGLGLEFLNAGLDFILESHTPGTFRLQVAAFNERAIRVYERAAFHRTREYRHKTNNGEWDFIEMSRPA